jgi:hypothetical protein
MQQQKGVYQQGFTREMGEAASRLPCPIYFNLIVPSCRDELYQQHGTILLRLHTDVKKNFQKKKGLFPATQTGKRPFDLM